MTPGDALQQADERVLPLGSVRRMALAAVARLRQRSKGQYVYYHWTGHVNSPVTRRIEPDPERAPSIAKLFESYTAGTISLKAITRKAAAAGLTNRVSGNLVCGQEGALNPLEEALAEFCADRREWSVR